MVAMLRDGSLSVPVRQSKLCVNNRLDSGLPRAIAALNHRPRIMWIVHRGDGLSKVTFTRSIDLAPLVGRKPLGSQENLGSHPELKPVVCDCQECKPPPDHDLHIALVDQYIRQFERSSSD